jgi:hypothetical protein
VPICREDKDSGEFLDRIWVIIVPLKGENCEFAGESPQGFPLNVRVFFGCLDVVVGGQVRMFI